MTAGKAIRVKYSRGLGGWVVYVGYDFVDGAFSQRSDAELAARRIAEAR